MYKHINTNISKHIYTHVYIYIFTYAYTHFIFVHTKRLARVNFVQVADPETNLNIDIDMSILT